MLLLVTLFVSALIAADGAISKKDQPGSYEVCEDRNDMCVNLKKYCNVKDKYGAIKEMCRDTCGFCKAPKMCPADHPFTYSQGKYCCMFNKEDIFHQLGANCDGSELSAASMCCKDNKFVACPHGKCATNTAPRQCPADHPFAYSKGAYCCKFKQEDIFPQLGESCDGSELSTCSKCCKGNKFVACPYGNCETNTIAGKGKVKETTASTLCPADHPFAYFKGTYCCKFNKEGIHPQFGVNCDGSELSSASWCCKDSKFVKCPHGKCATNPNPATNVCPGDHPYAYFKGIYCCKFNKEDIYPQLGVSCDGSDLSPSSMCCKDNKYVVCPRGKCATNTEPKTAPSGKSKPKTAPSGKSKPKTAPSCRSKLRSCRSGWIPQAGHICLGAKGESYGQFTIQREGFLKSLRLDYISGYLDCTNNHPRVTRWSCGNDDWRGLISIFVTNEKRQVIFPKTSAFTKYKLPGYHRKSNYLIFNDSSSPICVKRGQIMRIWYGEDLRNISEGDNRGRLCVRVSAKICS